MKIKPRTQSTKTDPGAAADALGEKYSDLKHRQKITSSAISELSDIIIKLGQEKGTQEGQSLVVHGKQFTVGLVQARAASFNQKTLARLLTPAQFNAVFPQKVVREFDSKAAKALIAAGKLNSSTLKKGVTIKKSVRVVVKLRKAKGILTDED